MVTRIQDRRGSAAQWLAANPVLLSGEPGFETDTGFRKTGDGATAWISLSYDTIGLDLSGTYARALVDVTATAFGADPTGAVSARSAWDAACAYAVANGRNTVYLPEGTYQAVPDATTGICLSIPAGIKRIVGAGRDRTIIKVKSSAGDYVAVLASASGVDVSGIEISDLTIDQNNTGNPVLTGFTLGDPLFTGKARFCVSVKFSTTKVALRNIRCVDMDNVNAFSVNGTARDVDIVDCAFELGTVATDHDHSTIYVNTPSLGSVLRVRGCTADAPGGLAGANGARTFIETHSGYQIIEGNISRGFQKGANASGMSIVSGEGSRWSNNNFIDCLFGIEIWSGTYSTNTGPVGFKGAVFDRNRIQLDLAGWGAWNGGTFGGYGIFLDRASNLPAHDVSIVNNHIIFKKGSYVGQAGDTASMGIVWRRTTPGTIIDKRITITGNIIDGALAGGMQFWTNGDSFTVNDNIIKNCGQGTVAAGGALSNGLGVGIILQNCTYTNSSFDRNKIVDDQVVPTTNGGLYLYPTAACVNSTALGNVVPANVSAKIQCPASNIGFLIKMDQAGRLISSGAALAAAGDTVTVAAHGLSNGAGVQLSQILTATGLSPGVTYYVVGAATNTFQLALTVGGSAIDITADGTANVIVNGVSLPSGWSAFGSEIADRTGGIIYRQTVAPEGATWATVALVQKTPDVQGASTGTKAATFDRRSGAASVTLALASGTCQVYMVEVAVPITSTVLRFITGTTAAITPTHEWAALTDTAGNVLAVTADVSTALGASAQFTWNWAAAPTLAQGIYYIHMMVAAATPPTLLGLLQTAAIAKYAPVLCGAGSTGQTTPPSVGGTLATPTTGSGGIAYLELG